MKILAILGKSHQDALMLKLGFSFFPGIKVQVLNQASWSYGHPIHFSFPTFVTPTAPPAFCCYSYYFCIHNFPFLSGLFFVLTATYLSNLSCLLFRKPFFWPLTQSDLLVLLTVSAANIHVTFEWSFINCLLCCILSSMRSGIWVGAACHLIPSTEGPGTHLNYF